MILEVVILNIIPRQEKDFEAAFAKASPIISGVDRYRWHEVQHCIEMR